MNEEKRLQEKNDMLMQQKEQTWHTLQQKQVEGIMAGELNSYQFMMKNMTYQLNELSDTLGLAKNDTDEQKEVVMQLSQELSGLEKLEEKQRQEHAILEQKAWELELSQQIARGMILKGRL